MTKVSFSESEYPSVYQAADSASVKSQKNYLRLIKFNLLLMISGAILTTLNFQDISHKQNTNIAAACLFGIAIILSVVMKICRYEKTWYGGRAVAESVKSLTWKYVTLSKPFLNLTQDKADKKFLDLLTEISTEKKDLAYEFDINTSAMISQKMRDVSQFNAENRLQFYLEARVNTQREWYKNKAQFNKTEGNKYSWFAISSQTVGFVVSLYLIKNPNLVNTTGIISSITVAIFSWMQIKKFQELAQAYSITANELGMAQAKSLMVKTDKELSEFVTDTENAISREHTMWIARRGQ